MPGIMLDAAAHRTVTTQLVHDPDYYLAVADLGDVTPGLTEAYFKLTPRREAVFGQCPTVTITSNDGGTHAITFDFVAWIVESRCMVVPAPVRITGSVGAAAPLRASLGIAPVVVQGFAIQDLTGVNGGGTIDSLAFGYDLDADTVFLCDSSAQATKPTILQKVPNVLGPLTPIAAGSLTSQKRHTRWTTGKATATTGSEMLLIAPSPTVQ